MLENLRLKGPQSVPHVKPVYAGCADMQNKMKRLPHCAERF